MSPSVQTGAAPGHGDVSREHHRRQLKPHSPEWWQPMLHAGRASSTGYPPSTSLTLHTSQHLLTPRKQTLSPPATHLLLVAQGPLHRAGYRESGAPGQAARCRSCKVAPGHHQEPCPASFCPSPFSLRASFRQALPSLCLQPAPLTLMLHHQTKHHLSDTCQSQLCCTRCPCVSHIKQTLQHPPSQCATRTCVHTFMLPVRDCCPQCRMGPLVTGHHLPGYSPAPSQMGTLGLPCGCLSCPQH